MKKKVFFFKELTNNEERFFLSSFIVFTFFSVVINSFFFKKSFFAYLPSNSDLYSKDKNYNVLLEQDFEDPKVKDEYKALSNKNNASSGKITEKKGFHTLSPFYKFVLGNLFEKSELIVSKTENKNFLIEIEEKNKKIDKKQKTKNSSYTQIPSNYRFQKDFSFNWNKSAQISIPTKNIESYEYFKNMIRQISESFALPGGGNYAYHDGAGLVVSQSILPGQIKVQFLLNLKGQVIDVKINSHTQSQEVIIQACIDAIRGQNFGPVPVQLQNTSLIFGINFIFPDMNFR